MFKIDSYASGFFLVIASGLLSIIGLLAVRRVIHARNLISNHDVGGYLLSVVGTLYAVILGLIVVDSMAKFQQARLTTDQESNALADIVLLSDRLPSETRSRIETLAITYIDHVVNHEWPVMDRGQYDARARRAAIDLINAITAFEPKDDREQAVYEKQLDAACDFWNSRRSRLVDAAHGVPALEWVVLIVGAVITVAFTFFFKLDHLKIQVVMTAMVSTIIALNLFLVLMFGYPFSGDLKVDPENFKVAQAIIEHREGRAESTGVRYP